MDEAPEEALFPPHPALRPQPQGCAPPSGWLWWGLGTGQMQCGQGTETTPFVLSRLSGIVLFDLVCPVILYLPSFSPDLEWLLFYLST